MPTSSSITLGDTIEWSKKLNSSRRSAIGNNLEPALTSANIVMQTIIGAPFAWRWNRVNIGFITTKGQQDYTVFNYLPSTAVGLGWFTIDDDGNSQICISAGTTGSSSPSWNHVSGGSTTDGTVIWSNQGSLNTQPLNSTYSVGFVEKSSIQDPNKGWVELTNQIALGLDSAQGRPGFIAAQFDDGQGNFTFRLMQTPSIVAPVVITIQKNPILFTKVGQSWSPIPDEYSRIYSWGFLSLMYLFADDPRFDMANRKFIASLLGASEGLTETEMNIFLSNWQQITGQPVSNNIREQQGYQARGV